MEIKESFYSCVYLGLSVPTHAYTYKHRKKIFIRTKISTIYICMYVFRYVYGSYKNKAASTNSSRDLMLVINELKR